MRHRLRWVTAAEKTEKAGARRRKAAGITIATPMARVEDVVRVRRNRKRKVTNMQRLTRKMTMVWNDTKITTKTN